MWQYFSFTIKSSLFGLFCFNIVSILQTFVLLFNCISLRHKVYFLIRVLEKKFSWQIQRRKLYISTIYLLPVQQCKSEIFLKMFDVQWCVEQYLPRWCKYKEAQKFILHIWVCSNICKRKYYDKIESWGCFKNRTYVFVKVVLHSWNSQY